MGEKLNPGLMQDISLTIPTLLEHAATNHGDTEVVARLLDGSLFGTPILKWPIGRDRRPRLCRSWELNTVM